MRLLKKNCLKTSKKEQRFINLSVFYIYIYILNVKQFKLSYVNKAIPSKNTKSDKKKALHLI